MEPGGVKLMRIANKSTARTCFQSMFITAMYGDGTSVTDTSSSSFLDGSNTPAVSPSTSLSESSSDDSESSPSEDDDVKSRSPRDRAVK